jgi:hypothetical protein
MVVLTLRERGRGKGREGEEAGRERKRKRKRERTRKQTKLVLGRILTSEFFDACLAASSPYAFGTEQNQ